MFWELHTNAQANQIVKCSKNNGRKQASYLFSTVTLMIKSIKVTHMLCVNGAGEIMSRNGGSKPINN